MPLYIKDVSNCALPYIRNEVRLHRIAAALDVSPKIIDTNYVSFIAMERIESMSLADKYGDEFEDIPFWIQEEIIEILWTLYSCAYIQYVDITPYNFIEHNGRVWCIDFGDAVRQHPKTKLHPFLKKVFNTWKLTSWNPDFK